MSFKQIINKIKNQDNINNILLKYKNETLLNYYIMITNDGYSMDYPKIKIHDLFIFIKTNDNISIHHYNYEDWYNNKSCIYNFLDSYTINELIQTSYYNNYPLKNIIDLYK